jgi:hypothetical protein
MGCKNSKQDSSSAKKEPRPNHSEKYPHLNYMTGEVTWKAYDAYDKLQRCNAQRNIDRSDITWRPSKSEWE